MQIQKEGCGRARGPPALRKLGQSRLVTSLLMEAASSVWIFLYCRQHCRETSWFLRISMLIIWAEITLYLPGIGPSLCPTFPGYRPFSSKVSSPPLHLPHAPLSAPCPTLSPMLEVHFCPAFKTQFSSLSTHVYL